MTRSTQNVFAGEPPRQGRQGSHLLVAGGNGTHTRRSAPEDAVLPGRAQQFGAGALAEDGGSLQRSGRSAATETFPLACGAAGGRSAGGARAPEPGAPGKDAAVRRMFSGARTVEASPTGSLL